MNRINQMIDLYITNATTAFIRAKTIERLGWVDPETIAEYLMDALLQREELYMWMKISKAVRGWQL